MLIDVWYITSANNTTFQQRLLLNIKLETHFGFATSEKFKTASSQMNVIAEHVPDCS